MSHITILPVQGPCLVQVTGGLPPSPQKISLNHLAFGLNVTNMVDLDLTGCQ